MLFDSNYGLEVQRELVGVVPPVDVEVDVILGSFVPLASGVLGRRPVVIAVVVPVVGHVRRVGGLQVGVAVQRALYAGVLDGPVAVPAVM